MATNHRPEIKGTDNAIWNRIKLITFDVSIPKSQRDRELPERLRKELPGILAWAVQGQMEWLQDGLQEPEEVKAATNSYRKDMDTLARFIDEECETRAGLKGKSSLLYNRYKLWFGPVRQLADRRPNRIIQRRRRITGPIKKVQLDHAVLRSGATTQGRAICHEHHPPIRKLLGSPGMREPQVGDELVGRSLHPPALQQGQQHDNPDSEDNAHDGHSRQNLGQGIPTSVFTKAEDLQPNSTHQYTCRRKETAALALQHFSLRVVGAPRLARSGRVPRGSPDRLKC
jgi:hypothetical protein